MTPRPLIMLLLMLPASCWAWNWHGSIRAKAQTDNRYSHDANAFGELWGQFFYERPEDDLRAAVDMIGRLGAIDNAADGKLYQGFIDKGFAAIDSRLKLGRFERTDNLGFYVVDGGTVTYAPRDAGWALEVYGGRPSRIDHVRSVDGEFVAGAEGRVHLAPGWDLAAASLDSVDLRGGYQHFEAEDDVPQSRAPTALPADTVPALDPAAFLADSGVGYGVPQPAQAPRRRPDTGIERFSFAANAAGALRVPGQAKYALGVLGTYRTDPSAFENVLLNGQLDLARWLRFRGSYEYYRPRDPYLTFREKFYSTYALGEQALSRGRVHLSPVEGLTFYVGGMYATRRGEDGYGGDLGGSYALLPSLVLSAEFDYLTLGPENARSAYASLLHTASSRLQLRLNGALRFEEKLLYGDNRATGAEGELRYMVRNDIILNVAGSYIWNTRLPDEYLGAVQFIYYFDNFKPKAM